MAVVAYELAVEGEDIHIVRAILRRVGEARQTQWPNVATTPRALIMAASGPSDATGAALPEPP
jgi:hypothetical protein